MRRIALICLASILTVMLAADLFSPWAPEQQSREAFSAPPSRMHPLGTDALGRDRWSRLLYGGRVSLLLAPAAALLSVALAAAAGLASVTLGAWWGRTMAVVIDLFLSLPWLFLLLAVRGMLPLNTSPAVSLAATFLLLGLLGWPGPARVIMAAAARQAASDHVMLARAAGLSGWRIAVRHILPNLAPVISAQFWTTAPAFLLAEANLALLGLGVSEPMPSWGSLLRELQNPSAVRHDLVLLVPLLLLVFTLSCCDAAQPAREHSL
jgi:peptide/nickel transport system permease protein